MGSYNYGKKEVVQWIADNVPIESTILDVGPCDGKWRLLLWDYKNIDAVEAFEPNAMRVKALYSNVYNMDVVQFEYVHYDLVIFGDVIEHMTVENAQKVLTYAKEHSNCVIVGVPYLYKQDAIYGNPFEVHIQDDLTAKIFDQRYPGFDVLCRPVEDYCYYVYQKS